VPGESLPFKVAWWIGARVLQVGELMSRKCLTIDGIVSPSEDTRSHVSCQAVDMASPSWNKPATIAKVFIFLFLQLQRNQEVAPTNRFEVGKLNNEIRFVYTPTHKTQADDSFVLFPMSSIVSC
jgi:hypothetical protein